MLRILFFSDAVSLRIRHQVEIVISDGITIRIIHTVETENSCTL